MSEVCVHNDIIVTGHILDYITACCCIYLNDTAPIFKPLSVGSQQEKQQLQAKNRRTSSSAPLIRGGQGSLAGVKVSCC